MKQILLLFLQHIKFYISYLASVQVSNFHHRRMQCLFNVNHCHLIVFTASLEHCQKTIDKIFQYFIGNAKNAYRNSIHTREVHTEVWNILLTSVNTKGKISHTLILVRIKNFDHCSLHGTLIPPEAPRPSPVHYSILNYILTYQTIHNTFLTILLYHLEYLLYNYV